MKKGTKRIGEILVSRGLITEAQLYDALSEQKSSNGFLGGILIKKGLVTDRQVLEALAEQFDIPFVNLKEQYIDMELARKFSSSLLIDHKCFPISRSEDTITVAIVNPLNAVAITKIEDEAKPLRVNLILVAEEDLNELIQNFRKSISEGIQRLLRKDKKIEP